jgi:phospholipid/cholesterol/gamma-HCH transport system substrate-binding protein
MENRSHALIAGLFTLLLGISCIAALWWFGGQQEVSDQYLVITKKNITGLNAQAQVRYRGIRVGKVESIELDPKDVSNTLIRISISKGIPITRGTTAKLGYQGITGIAHVLLEETGKDNLPLEARGRELPRINMQDSLIQELTDVGGDTLRNARDLMASANQVLSPENRQNISKILSNLEATTTNTSEATAQLHKLLTPENIQLLRSTLVHAEQTTAQAGPFFAEARGLVSRLQSVSEKLDATLGESSTNSVSALVPRLSELSAELTANSAQLNRVLQMLEDSPQSLIFGRQKAAPGPGEPGFSIPPDSREKP